MSLDVAKVARSLAGSWSRSSFPADDYARAEIVGLRVERPRRPSRLIIGEAHGRSLERVARAEGTPRRLLFSL